MRKAFASIMGGMVGGFFLPVAVLIPSAIAQQAQTETQTETQTGSQAEVPVAPLPQVKIPAPEKTEATLQSVPPKTPAAITPSTAITPNTKDAKSAAIAPQPASQPSQNAVIQLELRLTERRVVVLDGNKVLRSYPVAVGKPGWETPIGKFQIRQLIKNPTWASFYDNKVIPAGAPNNPLGSFWIGFWTDGKDVIGFHGTPYPDTVGKAITHGCVRMYNKDIEELFGMVNMQTLVTVKP